MLTHLLAGAEGTGPATGPVVDTCFPGVRMAIWALITMPPHLPVAVRPDEDVALMSILGRVPLALQHWAEQADVCTLVLICLLIRALLLLCTATCPGAWSVGFA